MPDGDVENEPNRRAPGQRGGADRPSFDDSADRDAFSDPYSGGAGFGGIGYGGGGHGSGRRARPRTTDTTDAAHRADRQRASGRDD